MAQHLKGLDTLRAIAALVVVWFHIELVKKTHDLGSHLNQESYSPDGHIAVILFFVLSGFLITYLLVKEKESQGFISFKKFYLRRILRIWPLYYIILLISFLIFNTDYSMRTIWLCLTIFPNVAHALGEGWTVSPQIWSIGVEEQFYLFWPFIFSIMPKKKVTRYLILFFIGYSIFPHLLAFINIRIFQNIELGNFINSFFYGAKFNCMIVGALLGFLFANKSKYLQLIGNKYVAIFSILLSLVCWFANFKLSIFSDEFYSILFAIALYNVVVNPRIHIDNFITSFIGRISYGIYMYHWIILLLVVKYLPKFESHFTYNFLLYFFVFGATIIVSWISYSSVEKYFLNLKKKFEIKTNRFSSSK